MAISGRRRVLGDERAKAVVFLGAGGAAAQMGSQGGHGFFGVTEDELAVDVDVELLEALVAGGLRFGGAEEPGHGNGVKHRCLWFASAATSFLQRRPEARQRTT